MWRLLPVLGKYIGLVKTVAVKNHFCAKARTAAVLIRGVCPGMTMVAGQLKCRAAQATP